MHWSKLSELSQLHSNPNDSSTIDLARDISDFSLTQLRFLHHSQQSSLAALLHRGNWWAASCSIVWIWRYFQLDKSRRLPPREMGRWLLPLCYEREENLTLWGEISQLGNSYILTHFPARDPCSGPNIGLPFSMGWAKAEHGETTLDSCSFQSSPGCLTSLCLCSVSPLHQIGIATE